MKREAKTQRLKRNLLLGCLSAALWIGNAAAKEVPKKELLNNFQLRPASKAVKVGGTVKLKLVFCVNVEGRPASPRLVCPGDDDYDRYAGELYPLVAPSSVKWEVVEGPGRVTGGRLNATYHAPASKPASNVATVVATFTYNEGTQKTIALSRITIVDRVKQYRGKATFQSPVADITAVANVIWTLVEKDADAGDDEADSELRYEASGTIEGAVSVPDCKTAHVKLPILRSSGGELSVDLSQKTYSFEFSSDSPVTLMCGNPWVLSGESFFHFGTGCGHPEGVPYTDVLALGGLDKCNTTGLLGTTTWTFEAVK